MTQELDDIRYLVICLHVACRGLLEANEHKRLPLCDEMFRIADNILESYAVVFNGLC